MKLDINSLTLEEKLKLLTGKDWWHLEDLDGRLPSIELQDGPNGLRRAVYTMEDGKITSRRYESATAFPTLSVVANTWNTALARLEAEAIADEFIEYNKDVILGPGVNIKRTPLCGRNFEYFSEDPYLSGTMGKAYVEGATAKSVATCPKHYCANNREYDRNYQSSEVDERTLREIYLTPFEIALSAEPAMLMSSYNPINGVYASENKWLLKDILRGDIGYRGLVVSDWYGVHESARAHMGGLDLEMPYREDAYTELLGAYEAGVLTIEEIDREVTNVVEFIEKTADMRKGQRVEYTHEERHGIARKIAEEGIVLLKNEDGILPLDGGKIFVGGVSPNAPAIGGGGSSSIKTDYVMRHLGDEIADRLGDSVEIIKQAGSVRHVGKVISGNSIPYAAYGADTVVLCVGTDSSIELESADRTSIRLPVAMENMILDTARVNKNIVVVLSAGSAIDVSPWIDSVKALVFIGYGGEGIQEATADVLTGIVSPSGKLAETFPICLDDTPTGDYRGNGFVDRYSEGIFVGYRYYDSYSKSVMFPFGYGLSYADFEYSDIAVAKHGETDYTVSLTVKNVSNIKAKETVELYVKDVFSSVSRPEKELKGYAKIELEPGEEKRVMLTLDARSFAYYSIPLAKWYVENGSFEVLVGASSRDIRLSARIDINLPGCEQSTPTVAGQMSHPGAMS